MSTLHDDLDLLTAAQPAQPVDRLQAVTRKARRIRATRAVAGGAAALLVAGSAAGLVQQRHHSTPRLAASPVTAWPDRSQEAAKRLGEGALSKALEGTGLVDGKRFLYRGLVTMPDRSERVVVVILATIDLTPTLFTLQADPSQLTDRGFSSSSDSTTQPWVVDTTPLYGAAPTHLGLVLRTDDGRNQLFSLDAPGARTLQWRQLPLPHSDVAVAQPDRLEGTVRSDNGVFTSPLPGLIGPVQVTTGNSRNSLAAQPLVAGTYQLVAPEKPAYGTRPDAGGGGGADTSVPDPDRPHRWNLSNFGDAANDGRHLRVYVRCYGGGTETYTVTAYDTEKLLATGTAACDGQTHQAVAYDDLPRAGFYLTGTGDRLQSYDYRFITFP